MIIRDGSPGVLAVYFDTSILTLCHSCDGYPVIFYDSLHLCFKNCDFTITSL